eukprot:9813212-Ditylum_brightwellii.AAC.1
MPYTREQQVVVWIDQNNPSAWDTNPTSNWQWTPAAVTHYLDTLHSVTCVGASHPQQKHPTFTSSWQTTKMFNVVDVKAIEVDKCT